MTYEYGTLRPPTPVEMRERYVPLETIKVGWLDAESWHVRHAWKGAYAGMGTASDEVWEGAVAELARYMADNCIPVGANLIYHECGRHQMALDWTHLELCEICKMWREPHPEDDLVHQLMLRSAENRKKCCATCEIDAIDLADHVQTPEHLEKVNALGELFTGEAA